MKARRVLLTGASGFIGSHLARLLLREGCEVTALLRPGAKLDRLSDVSRRMEIAWADLFAREEVAAAVKKAAPELVLHLAWCVEPGDDLHSPKNADFLLGSVEFLKAAASAGCRRAVMAGTSIEYAESSAPVAEDAPIKTLNAYSAAKRELFLTARELSQRGGWSFASGRIFNVYGPGENPGRLVPQIIRDLSAGRPCDLTDGTQVRDYLHVEDAASGFWAAARSGLEGAVNIGSGKPVKVGELAKILGGILGASHLLRFGAKPARAGEPRSLLADTSLIRSETGWRPSLDLEEGLRRTVAAWQTQGR